MTKHDAKLHEGNRFGLKATSDDMRPYLARGDIAIINPDDTNAQPGDYIAVRLPNGAQVVRRYVGEVDGALHFEALNPKPGALLARGGTPGAIVAGKVMHRLIEG